MITLSQLLCLQIASYQDEPCLCAVTMLSRHALLCSSLSTRCTEAMSSGSARPAPQHIISSQSILLHSVTPMKGFRKVKYITRQSARLIWDYSEGSERFRLKPQRRWNWKRHTRDSQRTSSYTHLQLLRALHALQAYHTSAPPGDTVVTISAPGRAYRANSAPMRLQR